METLHVDLAISMSEFKTNPAAVLRRAGRQPVAVLNHNRVSFYMLSPDLFQDMLEELAKAGIGQGTSTAPGSLRAVTETLLRQAQGAELQTPDNAVA